MNEGVMTCAIPGRPSLLTALVARVAVLCVALAVVSPTLAQTEEGSEPAPAEPVQVVPPTPAPPPPPVSEPNEAGPPASPPSVAPEPPGPAKVSPGEAAPAPVPPSADTPATPAAVPAPPLVQPAPAQKPGNAASARQRDVPRSASTLTIVNGRAVAATSVAVLAGRKVIARSGPLASNARVTLKLPGLKECRVSVVARFPLWYAALRSGAVNVCKAGHVLVRL